MKRFRVLVTADHRDANVSFTHQLSHSAPALPQNLLLLQQLSSSTGYSHRRLDRQIEYHCPITPTRGALDNAYRCRCPAAAMILTASIH